MKQKLLLVGTFGLLIILGITGCSVTTPPVQMPAAGLFSQQSTGIWVTGQGKTTAVPDTAILNLGVQTQAPTVAGAQGQASTAMNAVVSTLKKGGVADKDIQTQQFNITPVRTTNRDTGQQTLIGYMVTNTVIAKIRKVADTGSIIDAVAVAGGDSTIVNSISFTVDDPTPYLKDIRTKAMADAQARAQQLASEAGVRLGPPTYINESGYIPVNVVGVSAQTSAPAFSTPVSPGTTDITLSVQVVYSIR
jgi:uncharacterized protein